VNDKYIFPLIFGLTDGIVTSLMIATTIIINPGDGPTFLFLRIAFGSASVGAISFFTADYATVKHNYLRISRQMNPGHTRRVLGSKLWKDMITDSILRTMTSTGSGFAGALIPLGLSIVFGHYYYLTFLSSVLILSILGIFLARVQEGNYIFWGTVMAAIGIVMIIIGRFVHIVT